MWRLLQRLYHIRRPAASAALSQNYPNGIRVGNSVIEITGKTGKEYTRSGYSQYIERNDGQVYDDKLRAAGNLDEAVRASTDYVNEEIKHPRKDNIREFARGRVLMRVGQNDYNAEVVVGYTKNGEMLLYDIVNFKPDTFSVKERTSRQPGRGEAGMTGDYGKSSKVEGPIKSGPATTDNSISQNNAAVNSQYTQESENDAADTAETGADEGDFAVDREGSEASAAFGDEALDREGYTPTEQTRVIAMNEATRTGREYGASPAQQAAAEELSHILDRRVIFFRSDDPTINGYYKNGTIHVNAASRRTVASIIASEMTHAIETTSDYGALRELALRELSREKGMNLDELRAQKKETYAAHGENLDADGVDFELCEEYVGRYLFGDVAQIRAAVDYKPSLGRKIIAFLDEIIRRLTGRVRAVSSRILKDVQYARELWGRAVREAKARGAESKARESGRGTAPRFSMEKSFSEQIDDVINGRHNPRFDLYVSKTPEYLQNLNFPDTPILMRNGKVSEILAKHTDVTAEILKKIPEALKKPILVLKSKTNPKVSVVVITDIVTSKGDLIVPVWVNQEGNYLDIDLGDVSEKTNFVASAYGRETSGLIEYAVNKSGVLYQNPDIEKVRQLLARNGLQLPTPLKLSDSDITISQNDQFVNSSISENEKNDTRYSIEDSDYEKPITPRDVEAVQSIGRKSINAFTSEEIRKTQKWAHKFYRELGTKSPFFRAWFGEWRAHDTGEVKVAEIPEYAATNEARKANRGTVRNNDTGWDIRISRDGETNTISHAGGDKLSEYGLAGIRGLTENGVLLDSEVHEHHTNNAKNDMIAFDHKLYAVGRDTSGNVALYKITVEEAYHDHKHTNERRFHNLKYIEKVATVGGRTAGQSLPGVSTNDDIATTYTVADILSLVKTYDKDFTAAHDVAPELLNEDGTPKVFYHGTGANFTVFKSESGTYWFSESTDYAEAMAEERAGKNGRVGAFYLDMKNPYRAKLPPGQFTDPGYEKPIIEKAKSGGYDGVIIENDTDSDIEAETFYVVFSPNQIKSATDNIGTFDRGNNDTRYSIEDSGWDAYHRRNQEELESNTSAAERARREERAEERAAAEEEARRAAREEEALRRAEQEYAAAEEEKR